MKATRISKTPVYDRRRAASEPPPADTEYPPDLPDPFPFYDRRRVACEPPPADDHHTSTKPPLCHSTAGIILYFLQNPDLKNRSRPFVAPRRARQAQFNRLILYANAHLGYTGIITLVSIIDGHDHEAQ